MFGIRQRKKTNLISNLFHRGKEGGSVLHLIYFLILKFQLTICLRRIKLKFRRTNSFLTTTSNIEILNFHIFILLFLLPPPLLLPLIILLTPPPCPSSTSIYSPSQNEKEILKSYFEKKYFNLVEYFVK